MRSVSQNRFPKDRATCASLRLARWKYGLRGRASAGALIAGAVLGEVGPVGRRSNSLALRHTWDLAAENVVNRDVPKALSFWSR